MIGRITPVNSVITRSGRWLERFSTLVRVLFSRAALATARLSPAVSGSSSRLSAASRSCAWAVCVTSSGACTRPSM